MSASYAQPNASQFPVPNSQRNSIMPDENSNSGCHSPNSPNVCSSSSGKNNLRVSAAGATPAARPRSGDNAVNTAPGPAPPSARARRASTPSKNNINSGRLNSASPAISAIPVATTGGGSSMMPPPPPSRSRKNSAAPAAYSYGHNVDEVEDYNSNISGGRPGWQPVAASSRGRGGGGTAAASYNINNRRSHKSPERRPFVVDVPPPRGSAAAAAAAGKGRQSGGGSAWASRASKVEEAKTIDRRWRESLRRPSSDAPGGRAKAAIHDARENNENAYQAGNKTTAKVAARGRSSGATPRRPSVQPRATVMLPPTQLEEEIPYDYILVARNRSRNRHELPVMPVYAAPVERRPSRVATPSARDSKRRSVADTNNDEEAEAAAAALAGSGDVSAARSASRASRGYSCYDDFDESDSIVAAMVASAGISRATAAAAEQSRHLKFEQWQDTTAALLYQDVFVHGDRCRETHVPLYFEPALDETERAIYAECMASDTARANFQVQILRYRLSKQSAVIKTTAQEVVLSHADRDQVLPVVRALRCYNEEQNWTAAYAVMAANASRHNGSSGGNTPPAYTTVTTTTTIVNNTIANGDALRSTLAGGDGDHVSGVDQHNRGGVDAAAAAMAPHHDEEEEDVNPAGTSARGSHSFRTAPNDASVSATDAIAINSATTPGWMRHREFGQREWNELSGRRPSNGGGGMPEMPSVTRDPTVPAWMHRMEAARAAEEANDPQQQRLNKLDSASAGTTVSRSRRAGQVGYSIGNAERMSYNNISTSNRGGGAFGDMEGSLSFGAGISDVHSSEAVSASHRGSGFVIPRPMRIDPNAQHAAVVDNGETYEPLQYTTAPAMKEHQAPATAAAAATTPLSADDAARVTSAAPAATLPAVVDVANNTTTATMTRPRAMMVEEEAPIVFTLFPFSTFEARQEVKRMTYWAAAHGIDAFDIQAGATNAAATTTGPNESNNQQLRSYSPTFFPGTARLYEFVLALVQDDAWLRNRVTVTGGGGGQSASSDAGEVHLEVSPHCLREAQEDNWRAPHNMLYNVDPSDNRAVMLYANGVNTVTAAATATTTTTAAKMVGEGEKTDGTFGGATLNSTQPPKKRAPAHAPEYALDDKDDDSEESGDSVAFNTDDGDNSSDGQLHDDGQLRFFIDDVIPMGV